MEKNLYMEVDRLIKDKNIDDIDSKDKYIAGLIEDESLSIKDNINLVTLLVTNPGLFKLSYDRIATKVLKEDPYNDSLYYIKCTNGYTLIENIVKYDKLILDKLTIMRLITIAQRMPGTRYYEESISRVFEVIKKMKIAIVVKDDKGLKDVLSECEFAKLVATENCNIYTGIEKEEHKELDLRYFLLRYQLFYIENLTFPYQKSFDKLLYEFYYDQETYDAFIETLFVSLSLKLEEIGVCLDFVEDLKGKIPEIYKMLPKTEERKDIEGDVDFLNRILAIRPYCYNGSNYDGF